MSTALKFTVNDYDRLIETGFFAVPESRHVELINGELREMSPIGPFHMDVVTWLMKWSVRNSRDFMEVRGQGPIRIPDWDSQPEPDIAWVKPTRYPNGHPTPEDVFLLIEVADSSLYFDRREKAVLYARAGITEYWLVNIPDLQIEVYRQPSVSGYQQKPIFKLGSQVSSLAFPELSLSVSETFGK